MSTLVSPLAILIAAAALALAPTALRAAPDEPAPGFSDVRPAAGPAIEVDGRYMVPYVERIPGTDLSFAMIPVPGGELLLGSPADEPGRNDDEGPQVRVKVQPFWIGEREVTWAEYQAYMKMYNAFKQMQSLNSNPPKEAGDAENAAAWKLVQDHAWSGDADIPSDVDAVTAPTPLYMPDYTYMAGDQPDQPAVSMTQYAARQYSKWLSGLTGRQYRLPSEAEWEYAARAGSSAAYSFGADPAELEQYAWTSENAEEQTHPVGTKQPSAWGLYDMHGNAAEWTLDQYAEDRYKKLGPGPVEAWKAVNWPSELFPHAIRGGSWLQDASAARCAARQKSEEDEWKLSDPNLPLSPWWYTEEPAMGVGMRLARSLEPLSAEDQRRVWEAGAEDLKSNVASRLEEGRGAMGVADPSLVKAIEAAETLSDSP